MEHQYSSNLFQSVARYRINIVGAMRSQMQFIQWNTHITHDASHAGRSILIRSRLEATLVHKSRTGHWPSH